MDKESVDKSPVSYRVCTELRDQSSGCVCNALSGRRQKQWHICPAGRAEWRPPPSEAAAAEILARTHRPHRVRAVMVRAHRPAPRPGRLLVGCRISGESPD